jgi:hypothetical protein
VILPKGKHLRFFSPVFVGIVVILAGRAYVARAGMTMRMIGVRLRDKRVCRLIYKS